MLLIFGIFGGQSSFSLIPLNIPWENKSFRTSVFFYVACRTSAERQAGSVGSLLFIWVRGHHQSETHWMVLLQETRPRNKTFKLPEAKRQLIVSYWLVGPRQINIQTLESPLISQGFLCLLCMVTHRCSQYEGAGWPQLLAQLLLLYLVFLPLSVIKSVKS